MIPTNAGGPFGGTGAILSPDKPDDARSHRIGWRILSLALVTLWMAVVGVPSVAAEPKDGAELPAALRKYVAATPAWFASPWMTAPSCRDEGGDFSVWVENVIADTPELLAVFHSSSFGAGVAAEDRPRSDAILSGYRSLATETTGRVPAGYCVNDIERWAGVTPQMEPFGFEWGTEDTSIFGCTDSTTGAEGNSESTVTRNSWVGAERAPCDGFHLRCDGARALELARCEEWNEFSHWYVAKVEALRARAINAHPAIGSAPIVEQISPWKTVLVITIPVALVVAVLLGRNVRDRRQRPRAGGQRGVDGDETN